MGSFFCFIKVLSFDFVSLYTEKVRQVGILVAIWGFLPLIMHRFQ